MPIQYPDFRADPNAVPNAGGWKGIIDNVQKGYMLSQLPAQMKMQRQLQQAQLQKAQQEAYYYPQQQESLLGLQQAQTQGEQLKNQYAPQLNDATLAKMKAQAGLIGAQTASANVDLQRKKAFFDMLAQGGQQGAPQQQGSPQPMQQPQYQPGQGQPLMMGGQPSGGLSQQIMQQGGAPQQSSGMPSQMGGMQGGAQNGQQDAVAQSGQLTAPGNPSLYWLDNAYYKNPQYADQFKDLGYTQNVDTRIDGNSGMAITTTKWPSGRTTVSTTPVIDQAAVAQQKAIGQASGKSYEDITKDLDSTIKIQQNLDRLTNITKDPEFLNSTGPVTSFLNGKWGKGSPQANQVTSDIDAWSGEIQADMMAKIPGNAAKAKINFIGSFKPKSSDPSDVFAAKVDALNQSNQWTKDYSAYVAQALRQGVPLDIAQQQAERAIPFDKYTGSAKQNVASAELAAQYKKRGLPVSYVDNGQGGQKPVIQVMDEKGQKHNLDVDKYQEYLRRAGVKQ